MATAILRRMKKFRTSQIGARRNYVFPSTKESKKNYFNDPRSTWNLIVRMAQKKDITINYKCIHMLRHTFACLLLEATKDIKLVAKIMNWKSLKVAEIYADYIGKEHTEKGIEKLEKFLQVA
jgi:integrase